ncbi:MAG: DUF1266 domain-containing protein [Lachnoclostridium sp.]|nr:DUF1266 domain-containing protein [Lachnospira sp.]MCM1249182.1 DUF1266 domain-containing protein [Lachnoclostridium sp.]MCM1536430.1 DUF1266 domain-containing protein [Clostridium sp.]
MAGAKAEVDAEAAWKPADKNGGKRVMGLFGFGKKETDTETTDVVNDMERWCTDTYAIWADYAEGNWKLIGGFQKNRSDAALLRRSLKRDWGIKSGDELLIMIVQLLRVRDHFEKESDAWDYCRATQLAGMGYVAGYFTREILLNCSAVAAKVMQKNYNSWDELCQAYLKGYAQWCEDEEAVAERREIYQKLCAMPDGPYRIPWDFNVEPWLEGADTVYDIVMS